MAQPPLYLYIGNYNTSSWSLRAWLVLRLARLAFTETRIPLRRPETPGRIAEVSPSARLPVLLAEGVPIWDSLAIAEFVAELEPGIWPLDPIARAEARAISAEMHSGFVELRRLMPMDVIGRFSPPGRPPRGLARDIERIKAIWGHCRARFAPHGPFLFGAFSIADCMMAPVATRFVTHGVPIEGTVEDYVDSVMSWPDMVTWCDAAAAEQAQREAQGSLGVVSVNRPGRALGQDATERPAAQPGADTQAPSPSLSPLPVTAPAASPAAAAAISPDAGDKPAGTAAADAEPAPPSESRGTEATPTPDTALAPDTAIHLPASPAAEPEPPAPRRRLFETAAPAATESAPPPAVVTDEAAPASGTARAEAPAADNGPAQPSPAEAPAPSRDAPGQAPPKLGWIRRPVPADQLDADAPFAPDEVARPRPPIRPGSPTVKPIGGGILRRR